MNRSKIIFVTLLLVSGFACAMNDDWRNYCESVISEDSYAADYNPYLSDANDDLQISTQKMAQLDLNDPESSTTPAASEIVEDPFAHMISHCCSRGFESVVLREQFVESVRNRPNDEQFFSPKFISTIISEVHSREYSHPEYVLSVAFDPTGTLLATGCIDNKARIIDRETGKCLDEFPHKRWVRSVAFDPTGKRLATGCDDCKVRIIDRETGKCLGEFPHEDWVRSVAFDPKGTLLATGCIDNKARIIDRETGKCLDEFSHKDWVNSVAFDPTGKRLATGCGDCKVRIINRETGNCLDEFPHKERVLSVAFDPRGTLLATGCIDNKARIIAIENGNCLYEFPHKDWVNSVTFDPTGKWLATGCDDRKARIWNLLALRTARKILILPENLPQLYLLQACEIAMLASETYTRRNQYVCLTDEQLKTFSALPERIQNVLRIYTVTPEQYKRIKKIK